MNKPVWTPEIEDALRAGRAAGLSAREIGAKIKAAFGVSFSRAAIGAKADRMGLPKREPLMRHNSQSVAQSRRRRDQPKHPERKEPVPVDRSKPWGVRHAAGATALKLIDRSRGQCSWPVGTAEGADQLCCGQPVASDAFAFCFAHARVALIAPVAKPTAPPDDSVRTVRERRKGGLNRA